MIDKLIATVETLRQVDSGSLRWELESLRRESEWARAQLPVQTGDRVVIAQPVPTYNGWAPYREALAVGATGVVKGVDLSSRSGVWYADFVPDRCWSVSDVGARYWRGPVGETPDGYVPPSKFDQEKHPEGRKKMFALRLDWLEKVQQ